MLAQPPDSYQGTFPLRDPRFPQISQAHESAEEGWNRAEGIKDMQHHAMMQHGLRHAPLQQIHAERLGLEGGPDGGMHDHAPMTLAPSEYHTASERQSTAGEHQDVAVGEDEEDEGAWWDHSGFDPRERAAPEFVHRSPFRNTTQTGLVEHAETQTYRSKRRRGGGGDGVEEEGDNREGEGGAADTPVGPPQTPHHVPRIGWMSRSYNLARPPAMMVGRLGASMLLATGEIGTGLLGSVATNVPRGFSEVMGNWSQDGEEREPTPPPTRRPVPVKPPPPQPPAQPVPPFLLDIEERLNEANRIPPIGDFARRDAASRRAFAKAKAAAYPHWARANT